MSYENYGNLNSKICQLLDIFSWVRKKETFSLAFLHSSLRVVCEESKQCAENLFEIHMIFIYLLKCFQIKEDTLEKFVKPQLSIASSHWLRLK